ncbi:MAG TPA: trypsin-like peptidase domain-containing protein [Vicinamibacterales bacterium]|jgi:serine protease Do
MSSRKISLFYAVLIAIASMAVTVVITSKMDLTPTSSAQTVSVPSTNSAPLAGAIDAATFRNIAKSTAPAVVNIQTMAHARGRELTEYFGGQGGDDLLRRFFGGGDDDQTTPTPRGRGRGQGQGQGRNDAPQVQGAGTGFVIDKAGYILTNNHVVEGAEKIKVTLYGAERGVSYDAKVIGRDTLSDSALIQMIEMPSQPLTEVKFGDSEQMQPGDWVMAIGNPFQLGHTVTVGVISALGRPLGGVPGRSQNMLQTDAAINPGNSGGPLLNVRGEVVGINTAIFTDQRSANIGIGFATPINAIRDLLPQLRNGKVIRGVIGVQVSTQHLTPEAAKAFGLPNNSGSLISAVNPNGPADKAGLRPGDVVTEFNGKPVKDSDALVAMVVQTKPGTSVPLTVYRDNQKKSMNITIDELDLEAEQGRSARRSEPNAQQEPTSTGFGMTLESITPDLARRMDLPPNQGGAIVSEVDPDGAASAAGIGVGDVILEVNRQKVTTVSQVTRELEKAAAGTPSFLLVWRDGQQVFVTMTKH